MTPRPRSGAERVSSAERARDIVAMARAGITFAEIGAKHDITLQRAHQIYKKELAKIPALEVALYRKETLERLAHLRSKAMEVLDHAHVAISHGRVVRLPGSADPLLDTAPILNAIRTVLAIEAEQSKLLGLYAPTQVEATVLTVTQEDMAMAELVREAKTRASLAEQRIIEGSVVPEGSE